MSPPSKRDVQPSRGRSVRPNATPRDGRRRVVIERVRPEIDAGRFPIKRTVGESVRVTAWIHADGHDVLAAVLRYRPIPDRDRRDVWLERAMELLGNDEWAATFAIDRQCSYEYTVEAWIDRFESWRHELVAKVDARQDVSSELLEGAGLLRAVAERARHARAAEDARWLDAQAALVGGLTDVLERAQGALDDRLARVARRFPDRTHAVWYDRVLTVSVDRERARVGAWYEMFPRSWGPDSARSATFREAERHLQRVAGMGFDVVYLPPIHPIGKSFRKGRGNALTAGAADPGSPWAIGSEAGGHKSIDPALGTLDDFDHFVGEARRVRLEVALDLAYQCSPDHPYVREHPEWFRHRSDGTIKYAENPPKKYQDIYPFDFECDAWPALWAELKAIVQFWIARGVTIFRVDNPHTKPYGFWEWLIQEIRNEHPDVIFLAEAFTRPKVMYYLAKLGFTQSYTYFTWRNTKDELVDYFTELTGTEVNEFFRPNLFANTPDILHAYLQQGGRPAFEIRLVLAATLGATYGIYSGFELCENRAVPGTEEYLNSEKYQLRHRDWDQPGHIKDLVTAVNRIRRENPALHFNDTLRFCPTDNQNVIAFYKSSPEFSNTIFVIVNLDYGQMQHGWVQVPIKQLGLPQDDAYEVVDGLDGSVYTWRGERNYFKLDPRTTVAHVFRLPVAPPEVVARTSEALAQFLPSQRWFAGKARTIVNARLVDWSPAWSSFDGVMPTIAEVQYTSGPAERYFLPVCVVPEHDARASSDDRAITRTGAGPVIDALADDEACLALLSAILDQRGLPMRDGMARPTVYAPATGARRWPVIRSAAEHSNSYVVFGDRYVLKLLRRIEAGPNTELEMWRFLSARGYLHIPPLAASLEYARSGEEPTSLALLLGFVANDGTAWDHAVADVRRSLLRNPPRALAADTIAFVPSAEMLGQRTAELHLALAAEGSDPAFAPTVLTAEDVSALVTHVRLKVERALALLVEHLDSLSPSAQEHARAVLAARAILAAHIGALAGAPAGSMRTRVHGDYHLGQVLCAGHDFVIIDFEGEPARSLDERRSKQSPLRDVAGMLRSFSYAAHATLLADLESRSDLVERFDARARLWEASVSAAFLQRYRQTVAHASLVPGDDRSFERLLDAFLIEKALYELEYELASRPQWVAIPLLGILRILNVPEPRAIR